MTRARARRSVRDPLTDEDLRLLRSGRQRARYAALRGQVLERMRSPRGSRFTNLAADVVAIYDRDPEVRAEAERFRDRCRAGRGRLWRQMGDVK